jgi:tRNA G18 (ribose-2'-O)-methylase SpoU
MTGEVVADPADPRLRPFRDLRAAVRRRRAADEGRVPRAAGPDELLVVEGAISVGRMLAAGWEAHSVLLTTSHRDALASLLEAAQSRGALVLVGSRELLAQVTGLSSDRGCFATVTRPRWPPRPEPARLAALVARGRSLVVLAERVTDPANLGALIRNARAFGADQALCDPQGADPLDPRAVRASAGQVFELPVVVPDALLPGALALRDALGARLIAATTDRDAIPIERFRRPPHLLLAVGTEGEGLSPELLAAADERVTVPLAAGVDSLNVAAATAVLLHALR